MQKKRGTRHHLELDFASFHVKCFYFETFIHTYLILPVHRFRTNFAFTQFLVANLGCLPIRLNVRSLGTSFCSSLLGVLVIPSLVIPPDRLQMNSSSFASVAKPIC